MGRVIVRPDWPAGFGLQAFDSFLITHSMKKDEPPLRYDRAAESLTHLFFPDDGRSRFGPRVRQNRAPILPIASRPEKLGPVGRQAQESPGHKERSTHDGCGCHGFSYLHPPGHAVSEQEHDKECANWLAGIRNLLCERIADAARPAVRAEQARPKNQWLAHPRLG